jgi:hypothetical protein
MSLGVWWANGFTYDTYDVQCRLYAYADAVGPNLPKYCELFQVTTRLLGSIRDDEMLRQYWAVRENSKIEKADGEYEAKSQRTGSICNREQGLWLN